jgi:hypothetical protein
MDKISAAAIMSASLCALLGAEQARLRARGAAFATPNVLIGFVAAIGATWAIGAAQSVSGFLILCLVPTGAGWFGMTIGAAVGAAVRDRRAEAALVAALLFLFLFAWAAGFPASTDVMN